MVYRTVICVLSVVVVGVVLGCGDVAQRSDPATDSNPVRPLTPTVAPIPSPTATPSPVVEQAVPSATPAVQTSTINESAESEPFPRTDDSGPPPYYEGELSLEEMVAYHSTIVKVGLRSITSETGQFLDSDWPDSYGRYFVVLKLNLTVVEYLKGTGAANIIAILISNRDFSTKADAVATIPTVLGAWDSRWNDREALFFLNEGIAPQYQSSLEAAGYYFLAVGFDRGVDDYYTIYSKWRKAWLPATVSTSTPSDDQEFLLAPRRPGAPTITLGNMKRRIAEVTAELNGGDGSEAYKDCIGAKYNDERVNRYRESQGESKNYAIPINHQFGSGQASDTIVYSHAFGYGTSADRKARFWLDGRDSALFNAVEGQHIPTDDGFTYDLNVVGARPIPAGSYRLKYQLVPFSYVDCGHAFTTALTVNVVVPDGTRHELFFDPVTLRQAQGRPSTVGADDTNGVLKPATFTDGNGGSATIHSVSYEAGTVRVGVTPDDALAGHIMDIIELDGTVSLSLDVADATVDPSARSGQAGTLSWSVSPQPWEDGDMLMMRIREAR